LVDCCLWLQVLQECYKSRYPAATRTPRILWRGSTTDTHWTSFNKDNWLQANRIRAHLMMRNSTTFDLKLTAAINTGRAHSTPAIAS
jgi:hypothetical protein